MNPQNNKNFHREDDYADEMCSSNAGSDFVQFDIDDQHIEDKQNPFDEFFGQQYSSFGGEGCHKKNFKTMMHMQFQLCNPIRNVWDRTTTQLAISGDGLAAHFPMKFLLNFDFLWKSVYALLPFPSVAIIDGAIGINYFEVTTHKSVIIRVGLSTSNAHQGPSVGNFVGSFAMDGHSTTHYYLSGFKKELEWPTGANKPSLHWQRAAQMHFGCGLLHFPNGSRSIFFTMNGQLLGKHIPIDCDLPLYPAASMTINTESEVNFGDNPHVPFAYDPRKCAGLDLN